MIHIEFSTEMNLDKILATMELAELDLVISAEPSRSFPRVVAARRILVFCHGHALKSQRKTRVDRVNPTLR
jgi:hypothetical protein